MQLSFCAAQLSLRGATFLRGAAFLRGATFFLRGAAFLRGATFLRGAACVGSLGGRAQLLSNAKVRVECARAKTPHTSTQREYIAFHYYSNI